MRFDPHKHHRRSIRLSGYDYTQAGVYFITMVTWQRECLLGEIMNGEMKLSPMGQIADETWRTIPEHFPGMELGAHVVMPNHLHGIIVIRRGTIYRAPTDRASTIEQFGKPVAGSIPTIVRTYKAAVTRLIGRLLNSTHIWQRNYFEHVIHSEAEHQRIYHYIEANIENWDQDEENTANQPGHDGFEKDQPDVVG